MDININNIDWNKIYDIYYVCSNKYIFYYNEIRYSVDKWVDDYIFNVNGLLSKYDIDKCFYDYIVYLESLNEY